MKVSIQVLGSLGDVMPYITIARQLQDEGASVSLLAPKDYSALIDASGIEVTPPPAFSLSDWMAEAADRGTLSGPYSFFRDWNRMIRPHIDSVMARCLEAAADADIVVANLICAPARVAAESHRKPFILTAQQPVLSPTRHLPCAMIWRPAMGNLLNRQSYLAVKAAQKVIGVSLSRHREALGLPNRPNISDMRTHLGRPLTKVTSLPHPLVTNAPYDWHSSSLLTPYPSLSAPDDAELDPALLKFLGTEAPPIYLGLGSLDASGSRALLDAFTEAVSRLGQRAIITQGLAGDAALDPDTFLIIESAPHDLLFPRCAAVVHHGGAGTTDTALRAGIPQILQPHFLDQFWYADRLRRLGTAPRYLRRGKLTADDMARAIETALSATLQDAAGRQGEIARSVDGAGDIAKIILLAASDGGAELR